MFRKYLFLMLLAAFGLTMGQAVIAQEEKEEPGFFEKLKKRVDIDPRTGFFGYHEWKYKPPETTAGHLYRAGCPQNIAPWARCQDDRFYHGYYVGGGAAFGGDRRCYHEGTWGWDYGLPWQRIKLGWFHGRRYQAGEGQYDPDSKNDPTGDLTDF